MADEPVVPPVPDPNAPPPAPASGTPAPAAAAPAAAPPPEGSAPPAGTPPAIPAAEPQVPQAVFQRIDRLTKDKKEAEERAKALEDRLRAQGIDPLTGLPVAQPQPQGGTPAPAAAPVVVPAEEIERRAQALAAERAFNESCNRIAAAGEKAHQDFGMRVGQLNALGVMTPDMLGAVMEIGDEHEILYALAQDLNEATRIASLPIAQQAVALMKFNDGRKARAASLVSSAPPPPSTGVGTPSPVNDSVPRPNDKSDDWFAKREKQIGISSGNYN